MRKMYTFKQHLKESLRDDPEFRKAWEDSEPEWKVACAVIEKRLAGDMSQRQLARKMKTTQAVISRLETMDANPTVEFLQRLARALNTKITLSFG